MLSQRALDLAFCTDMLNRVISRYGGVLTVGELLNTTFVDYLWRIAGTHASLLVCLFSYAWLCLRGFIQDKGI